MIQTKRNLSSKLFKYRWLVFCGMLGWGGAIADSGVNAQISSDGTLSTEVELSNDSFEISGGTVKGDNLFHSFQEFSLPSGNTAQFNNSPNIDNIIGRVTGGSISEINGLIRAIADTNLILINPAGINFGADARLDIGGSFLGSTASSLVFADGTVFTATQTSNPLLTVSVPVGLQLGQNSGAINVEGQGHNLSLDRLSHPTKKDVDGLKVNSGQTLTLVGNNLALTGGTLTAESGKIELASVAQGTVGLNSDDWTLDDSDVSLFGNIDLRGSQLDVSGVGSGAIALFGKQVLIEDGSAVIARNLGNRSAGNISVNATESLTLIGTDPVGEIASGLYSETIGEARGANIEVTTPRLIIEDGAEILATASSDALGGNEGKGGAIELNVTDLNLTDGGRIKSDNYGQADGGGIRVNSNSLNISDDSYISSTSFGSGQGGNISLNVAESVSIVGKGYEQYQQTFQVNALGGSLEPRTRSTGIFIGTAKDGAGGSLQLNTDRLSLREGGIIFSPIFTTGVGGNLEINADDLEISSSAVQISAGADSTSLAVGGNVAIDTERLVLQKGGAIINATFGDGTGGDININAAESILLEDTPENSLIFTGIYAKTITGNGDAGGIDVTTKHLKIDDALISSNTGIFFHNGLSFERGGNGGNISIKAVDAIEISGIPIDARFASGISSSTVSNGAAGNIEISTDKLSVEDGSEIAAITIGSGDGGNLTIEANSIELIGTTTMNSMQRGGLIAASGRETFPQQQASGASGDISVTANSLTIERAGIDVQSIDLGSAGNLDIQVDGLVSLDNGGKISAETDSDTGGNIAIVADNIFWLGNSTTTATASNQANGGNIEIVADNLIALQGSRLTADADAGTGGNIFVDAKGLYVCQTCRVSASSGLGIDGVVNINTLNFNPDFEAADMPLQLTRPETAVDLACSSNSNNSSSLTVSGRGGLPPRPSEVLNSKSSIDFADSTTQAEAPESVSIDRLPAPARSWHVDSQGRTILTASSAKRQFNSSGCDVR